MTLEARPLNYTTDDKVLSLQRHHMFSQMDIGRPRAPWRPLYTIPNMSLKIF